MCINKPKYEKYCQNIIDNSNCILTDICTIGRSTIIVTANTPNEGSQILYNPRLCFKKKIATAYLYHSKDLPNV